VTAWTSYLDGEPTTEQPDDEEPRVQLEGAAAEGLQDECHECGAWYADDETTCHGCKAERDIHEPRYWLNSVAAGMGNREAYASISVGDPRGAFGMQVRRWNGPGLLVHTPYPGESLPHEQLEWIRAGTMQIVHDYGQDTAKRSTVALFIHFDRPRSIRFIDRLLISKPVRRAIAKAARCGVQLSVSA
jgi:hypothetical protein